MEPIIIKKGKKEYAFSHDKLVIKKKNKTTHEIYYDEIKEITYNPEFGFGDLFSALMSTAGGGYYYTYNAFNIILNNKNKIIGIKLSNDDFEKVKNIIPLHIEII